MKAKWVMALIGVGLGLAKLGTNKVYHFEYDIIRKSYQTARYHGEKPLKIALMCDYVGGNALNRGQLIAEQIKKEQVDLLVLIGELFHKKGKNQEVTALLNTLVDLPIVYVPSLNKKDEEISFSLRQELTSSGVVVLENGSCTLDIVGTRLSLLGLGSRRKHEDSDIYEKKVRDSLGLALHDLLDREKDKEAYHIILSAENTAFHLFGLLDSDLILTRQLKGKMINLPFLRLLSRWLFGLKKVSKVSYKLKKQMLFMARGFNLGIFKKKAFKSPQLVIIKVIKNKL